MTRHEGHEDDEVARCLASYEQSLTTHLRGTANVLPDEYGGVLVDPFRRTAARAGWVDNFDELVLWVSDGGRWELPRDMESAQFVRDVIDAVIAGRASEVFGPARSAVTVRLPTTTASTSVNEAPRGCLPAPGWARRGRRVDYAPYTPPAAERGLLMPKAVARPTDAYSVGRGNEPPDARREIAAAVLDAIRPRAVKAVVSAYADSDWDPLPPDAEAARTRLTGGSSTLRARTRHVDMSPLDAVAWETIYAFAPWSAWVDLEDEDEQTVASFQDGWLLVVMLTDEEKRALVSRLGTEVRVCESREVLSELRAQRRRAIRQFWRFLFGRGGRKSRG